MSDAAVAAIDNAADATPAPAPPSATPASIRPGLPGEQVHPLRRTIRYWLTRGIAWVVTRAYLRPRLEHRERLPSGPAIYCFNHLNWIDPFVLMATLPMRPRLYFFGPKEEDMAVGGRNRIMNWTCATVPYRPGKSDLIEATRRVSAVLSSGGVLAIAGEGTIHASERELLPLEEGPAYFALRSGVPIVPIAISGTSWLKFGRRVRVVVGEPIDVSGRPRREAVDALTGRTWSALHAMVEDRPDFPPPGPVGRWFTEVFNDWHGPRPAVDPNRPPG